MNGNPNREAGSLRPPGKARLLADIGGTNARFGWQPHPGAPIEHETVLPTSRFGTIYEAVRHYLDNSGRPRPTEAGIAIATPVHGDRVDMTNHHWGFSIESLRHELGLVRLRVVNDFEALAMAVPGIRGARRVAIKPGVEVADAPRAVIGPGTGLGVGTLVRTDRGWMAIPGEGGHVTLAPDNENEFQLLSKLRARFGHASGERVLSGSGLIHLYEASTGDCARYGSDPALLLHAALAGTDLKAIETLNMFCGLLGSVAGNLALTIGARGGLYLAGGILPRMKGFLAASPFATRFQSKGRLRVYLEDIPVYLVDAGPSVALEGAALLLDQVMASDSPTP